MKINRLQGIVLSAVCLFAVQTWAQASAQLPVPDLALRGARVYANPQAAPIDNAVVLIHDGHIAAVSSASALTVPSGVRVLDCSGKIIVAGFWNSHVHFETGWDDAAHAPVAQLEGHLQQMLTRWGFTTVWDLGSVPENTLALRSRIESGEIPGPQILMAGDIFPLHGHPVYLPASLQLPEAATPDQAREMAERYLHIPLDGIKLFTGAFMGDAPVINMPEPIAAAAVDVAHAQHKPVFAHPQNYAGVDNALAAGVDILAHTIPTENGFTPAELARMKQQHSALIPTLTLWTTVVHNPAVSAHLVDSGVSELKSWAAAGGTVLFGTDVGFQSVYDTTQEYQFMGRALGWREILASLTTAPSDYFHQPQKGRIEPGSVADLVVLDGDPATDVANLARVHTAIRGGRVIYEETPAR
ncbi:amidohydrolase family protein [Silvibacterium dinghuense]|uniref:4-alpha-glucanotransferase n=1 Tax=Silvibacterium dinghuense TaxID=1560006 RepID=A0A4Q1SGQ2_9BACT|nr:amidohydrolase family protein [Silvibacterium dinghuense]RXS96721.1 4-alpha-glucanotransferase [Silvibacterium dinghuense]GGG93114.1 Xaa-Pro dipeptidase [Silvibacterium dinghuense]